jgi:Rod binding domain-containing protein
MQINTASLDVNGARIDELAARARAPLAAADADLGSQFESLFVSMMLKEMRQTVSEDGLFAGDSSDTYGGLFDMFLGQHMAQGSPLGIGKLIEAQLGLGDAA